jgi:hypothetical protein
MSQRLTATRRIDSAQVQGEGSFVILRNLTVGEASDFIRTASGNAVEVRAAFLAGKVVEWNWVDGDGNPLPQPTDESVLRLLTLEEQMFLVQNLFARPETERKN